MSRISDRLGEGDILRRAMGKKVPEIMQEMKKKFVKGCKETNNISEKLSAKIFENIERFAGYGFNKSHSAAYAILSYHTAFLKAHYPAEFIAASMSLEMGNAEKLPKFINDALDKNIPLLPPDVNESGVRFRPIADTIRFGMAGVKNVGVGAVEAIVKERDENGPFESLVEFCIRLDSSVVNKKVLENLVKCGAFDFSGMDRGRLFNGIEFAMNRAAELQRDRKSGQGLLFDMMDGGESDAADTGEELPPAESWPAAQRLAEEKSLLGFYVSGHPLKEYGWELDQYGLAKFADLETLETGTQTRLGGLVVQFMKRFTKKTQEPMGIFKLEGLDMTIEAVAFPDAFREYGVYLTEDAPVLIGGEYRNEEGRHKIQCNEIYPLKDAAKHFTKKLAINVPAENLQNDKLILIRDVLRKHPGEIPVVISLAFPGGERVLVNTDRNYKVQPNRALMEELGEKIGHQSIFMAINKQPYKKYKPGGQRWAKKAS
ncbi:MAG: hypothetical protein AAF492_07635 [Verrucomicrobiota bacterium]